MVINGTGWQDVAVRVRKQWSQSLFLFQRAGHLDRLSGYPEHKYTLPYQEQSMQLESLNPGAMQSRCAVMNLLQSD